jgi:acyl-CoA hydrolase
MENAKTVKQSQVETRDIVHPSDVNAYNYVFGGHLTSLLDKAACIAAYTHARCRVTTVSIDNVRFFKPATVGTILTIKASVNRAFNTSMEVGVKVMGVHPQVSWKPEVICHAYMTFVAIDDNGKPTPIPSVIPETEDEIRRYEEAGIRREAKKKLLTALENK